MIVLGPAPCQACRRMVWWNGIRWNDRSGLGHSCGGSVTRATSRLPSNETSTVLMGSKDATTVNEGARNDAQGRIEGVTIGGAADRREMNQGSASVVRKTSRVGP